MSNASFDVVVIGGGPGGYVAAIKSAKLGLKVAIIEKRDQMGGTCMNEGCIPSKALLDSSKIYYQMTAHNTEHGITAENIKIDVQKMINRKNEIVNTLAKGIDGLLKGNKITVYYGHGKLVSNTQVEVENFETKTKEILETKNIILATGSVPKTLPFLPKNPRIITSTEALTLAEKPTHLSVIGAGAIGLEMASVWARLGSLVTVIEALPSVLPGGDEQISRMLERTLLKQNFKFLTGSKIENCIASDHEIKLLGKDSKNKPFEINASHVLVAIGRKPYYENLGLETLKIETLPTGFIKVNETYQTNIPNIYAIGDLIGNPMLAHKAEEEAVIVSEIIAGHKAALNYDAIPNVVYTFPEVATVGLTETKAKEKGFEIETSTFYFKANGRAVCMDASDGFVKTICDKATKRILGVHILGPYASEMITECTLAIEQKLTNKDLGNITHPHPTLSEAVKESALQITKDAIHALSR